MNGSADFIDRNVIGWGNRGWLDIIDFILEVCKNGSLKTHIMYKCNLNSKQVERYIQFLLRCRLLDEVKTVEDSKRQLYKTTDLGRKYTGRYKELAEIFN
ncbi:winged helix-turn-helix domain-containing protein [Candidatus Nitrosotenuis cloacae]|jgi:predicted transcriptional regulator|uniref:winged helix-turn-helix domain-containing protein n=1 Tax=Candidatus Nitrosotenuis cloacae TaxID=1603555 RepID=UPI00228002F1|nr:winged helix-turn-helix domain-containing protein [Candidatus Nitrosotenuis cloacae]